MESPRTFDFRSPARPASGLEEACAEADGRVLQWRRDRAQGLKGEVQRSLKELYREQIALKDLQADLLASVESAEATARLRQEDAGLAAAVRRSAEAARARHEVAVRARQGFCEAEQACQRALLQLEGTLAEQRDSAAEEAERFLEPFRERLGLSIAQAAPQAVRLAFTLLDDGDPEREFCFTLGMAGCASYSVSHCSPRVPQLGELLERLNREPTAPAALPAFVCGMRRAFRRAAAAAEQPGR